MAEIEIAATNTDTQLLTTDMRDARPLGWILEPLDSALQDVTRSIRVFARAQQTGQIHRASQTDAPSLRGARQQMHQVAGALRMVAESAAWQMAQAMENALHELAAQPQRCDEAAVQILEQAGFALLDYLRERVGTAPRSAVGLFVPYSQVQKLAGASRIHPADLWDYSWQWQPLALAPPKVPDAAAPPGHADRATLQLMRGHDPAAAATLKTLFWQEAAHAGTPDQTAFYTLAAAFFEALEHAHLALDVPVKRTLSQVLLQQHSLRAATAPAAVPERLLLDLLFFCEQSQRSDLPANALVAQVAKAWQLARPPVLSYREPVFGLYDPQALQMCQRRVKTTETSWSALVAGDKHYLSSGVSHLRDVSAAADQLSSVLAPLARALDAVATDIARSGRTPTPALGMEVATALLFLQAILADFRPSDPELPVRITKLATRLRGVAKQGQALALEPWMEALYRNVSDQQNMDTVVGELRTTLAEIEQRLDAFFRPPHDREPAAAVLALLAQMRSVLSVLGLDEAVAAVAQMRSDVEHLLDTSSTEAAADLVQRLSNSMGVLGFLLDTLSYQPALARELFVCIDGELRFAAAAPSAQEPVLAPAPAAPSETAAHGGEITPRQAADATPTPTPAPAPAPAVAAPVVAMADPGGPDSATDDLTDIFLGEARSVTAQGLLALQRLDQAPDDAAVLTQLRRAFHTLKGSARMVNLDEFSAAAWSLEQLLNGWLATGAAASEDLRAVARAALTALQRWLAAVARSEADDWRAQPFEQMADALRTRGERHIPPLAPDARPQPPAPIDARPAKPLFPDLSLPAAPADTAAASPAPIMQQVGKLRLSSRLHAAFVEEATDWCEQLRAALTQWQSAPEAPPPAGLRSHAHALAGSSATVGHVGLAELARQIDQALQAIQEQDATHRGQALAVVQRAAAAAQESVHAFAQGQLLDIDPHVSGSLQELIDSALDSPAHGEPPATGDAVVDELTLLFADEASELLEQLSAATRHWSDEPADGQVRDQILRVLHTLKGSARLAGATDLGNLVHEVESRIQDFVASHDPQAAPSSDIVAQIDRIYALFEQWRRGHRKRLAQTPVSATADVLPSSWQTPRAIGSQDREPLAHPTEPGHLPGPLVLSVDDVDAEDRRSMVRVRASLLDHLTLQLGELVISRASLEKDVERMRNALLDLNGSLANLRRHLREVELQAEVQTPLQLQEGGTGKEKFDPLEFDRYTRMQELTRMMAEAVDDVATVQRSLQRSVEAGEDDLAAQRQQSRELQHALLRARMVEFDAASERLHRLVRQVSEETGHPVSLRMVGGGLELDRSILDRLMPMFGHMLRNSIVHGFATSTHSVREVEPRIILSAEALGPNLIFEIKDNGSGLPLDKLREKAQSRGLAEPGQALSDEQAAQLVFEPAISTASTVTELAGRGVGLDVVRAEIRALGGQIAVSSRAGMGTTFRMVVPATQALTQVTLVRMGELTVGIPSNLIESVQTASADVLTQAYKVQTLPHNVIDLPFFWIGALLGHSARGTIDAQNGAPFLVCRSAEQQVALHVDEVLDVQDVVVRSLGPQLARLPGLVAITVLTSSDIVLIYNPVALAKVYEKPVRALMAAGAASPAALPLGRRPAHARHEPLILVVDDSVTVRRVIQRLLQRHGYRVVLAADGEEGLARIAEEHPAVVLSDIEMPNMDGYDMLREIRAQHTQDELPVVMITSRAAEKHRAHAMELGASAYLPKPYAETELLELLSKYTDQRQPARARTALSA